MKLPCPSCGDMATKVTDSRPTMNGCIRRRRECLGCKNRFSTIELAISDYENENMYFRKNVTKVMDKAKALHDALGMFLGRVSHTECPMCDVRTKPPVCKVPGCPIDGDSDELQGSDNERVGEAVPKVSSGDPES